MINDDLLHKWINKTISESELEEFKKRPEFPAIEKVFNQSEEWESPEFPQEKILQNILAEPKNKLVDTQTKQPKTRNLYLKIISTAAIVLIGVGLAYLILDNNIATDTNGKTELVKGNLPDNSTYVLNAKSELNFDAKSFAQDRKIDLIGEAYFEVAPGSRFTVLTPSGKVEVLGTKFNVRSWDGILTVHCDEGKVKVFSKNNEIDETITVGEVIRIEEDNFNKWNNSAGNSWTKGIINLHEVSILEVLNEIERQFNVNFMKKELINLETKISCNFQTDNLETALKTSLSPANLNYKINDQTITFIK